jgi:transposase
MPTGFSEKEISARLLAIDEIVAGKHSQSHVARQFQVSRQLVSQWVSKRKQGKDISFRQSIAQKVQRRGHGSSLPLNNEEIEQVRKMVQTQCPEDLSIPGEKWNLQTISQLLAEKYNRISPQDYAKRLLDEVKTTPKRASAPPPQKPNKNPVTVSAEERDYFKEKIREAHEVMQKSGVLDELQEESHRPTPETHGVRVGRHAKSQKKKPVRKKEKKRHKKRKKRGK